MMCTERTIICRNKYYEPNLVIISQYREAYLQKQPFPDILQNRLFKIFCNIHRKALVLQSLVNRNSVNIAKF